MMMTQDEALQTMKDGKNVFLTGAAGTGKSYTLSRFIEWAKDQNKRIYITATTGIAGTNIGGRTVHSYSSLFSITIEQLRGISDGQIRTILKKGNGDTEKRIRSTDILVIDEVSMLNSYMLNFLNRQMKMAREDESPFGGVQLIVCGDFFQLPPVVNRRDFSDQSDPDLDRTLFAFQSDAWEEANFHNCYLYVQYRTHDDQYTQFLNNIRNSNIEPWMIQYVKDHQNKELSQPLKIYTHNVDVDIENERGLAQFSEHKYKYFAQCEGKEYAWRKLLDWKKDASGNYKLKPDGIIPHELTLCVGCPVMFIKNDKNGLYVNGTQGVVTEVRERGLDSVPVVTLKDGSKISVEPQSWEVVGDIPHYDEDEGYSRSPDVLGRVTQIPLRLAWAITTHKSQGMSLDEAVLDLEKAFSAGQGYVAFSRLRSGDGLSVLHINTKTAFYVHPVAMSFDEKVRKL